MLFKHIRFGSIKLSAVCDGKILYEKRQENILFIIHYSTFYISQYRDLLHPDIANQVLSLDSSARKVIADFPHSGTPHIFDEIYERNIKHLTQTQTAASIIRRRVEETIHDDIFSILLVDHL